MPRSLIGQTIQGRYLVKSLVGEGGMGVVYRGEHTLMRKEIAIKVLHPELGRFEGVAKRFQREAQSASRLDHPGIIQVYDFGQTDDGQFYLVQAFLDGRSLAEVMQAEGKLQPQRAYSIALQIASALDHAHSQGVIHRDLKPENVMMVEREGVPDQVRLLDFGIAKITQGDESAEGITQAGVVFGTPAYIAPEQAAGDPADQRADLYALGVILFEMLAGRKPYLSDTNQGYLSQHMNAPIPTLWEVAPEVPVPTDVDTIITRALAKQPADRFQSADEMLQALSALPGLSIHASVSGLWRLGESGSGSVMRVGASATLPIAAARAQTPVPESQPAPAARWHWRSLLPRTRRALVAAALVAALGLVALGVVLLGGKETRKEATPAGNRPTRDGPTPAATADTRPLSRPTKTELATPPEEKPDASIPSDSAEAWKAEADAIGVLVTAEQLPAARSRVEAAIARHPRAARLHHLLGQVACAQKDPGRCLTAYGEALKLDPESLNVPALIKDMRALLTWKEGPTDARKHREAAVALLTEHLAIAKTLSPPATEMLTAYVNRWWEADLIWPLLVVLRKHRADQRVDYLHVYEQRLRSESDCEKRKGYLKELEKLRDKRLLPLVKRVYVECAFRKPRSELWVSNLCLQSEAKRIIRALGGRVPKIRMRCPASGSRQAPRKAP